MLYKVVNHLFREASAGGFGDETRIGRHRQGVKVGAKDV
jgi:hypothetical protein